MQASSLAAIISIIVSGLGACQSLPRDTRPCGVIRDSLKTVNATTPEGQLRLAVHYERGRAVGCW